MSDTLSFQAVRSANQAREADEQKTDVRKKNLLILVLHYLTEEGYRESAQSLAKETNIDLNRFEVCDNVDLDTVLMEYESFYYIKFSRYPKITKKLSQSADDRSARPGKPPGKLRRTVQSSPSTSIGRGREGRNGNTPALPKLPPPPQTPPSKQRPVSGKRPTVKRESKQALNGSMNGSSHQDIAPEPLALHGMVVHGGQGAAENNEGKPRQKAGQIIDIRSMINDATKLNVEDGSAGFDQSSDRLLKPLGGYVGYTQEWRELAQVISRDIYLENPDVRWDDIIGLDTAKQLVKEAVVYPIKYPHLFTGILSPWKGLLLYGPPGTGKTLLAKAVATECKTTFFNISASSIVSKWRGESEKLVRVLFELARFHAPSTIFLDELESVMSQRGSGGGGEHEGSRRMKTELLVQMDGLAKTDDLVFLLAASNLPWELDHAMLRRLEKRILVDLPTHDARQAMFLHHLPPIVCNNQRNGLILRADLDYNLLAEKTDGYSGSDLRLVCKESAMMSVRKIFTALENHTDESTTPHIQLDTVVTGDVEITLKRTKPSARTLSVKYAAWAHEYESV